MGDLIGQFLVGGFLWSLIILAVLAAGGVSIGVGIVLALAVVLAVPAGLALAGITIGTTLVAAAGGFVLDRARKAYKALTA